MLYVYRVDSDYIWHSPSPEDATPDNGWDLIDTDDIDTFLWEERCQVADSEAEWEEDEDEYGDFVENTTYTAYFPYDPALHAAHKGYEEQRPEHAVWAKENARIRNKEKIRRAETALMCIEADLLNLERKREELVAELEGLLKNESLSG